jgi:hypothetical protein
MSLILFAGVPGTRRLTTQNPLADDTSLRRDTCYTWLESVMVTLSALLLENGLPDLPALLIEPHRDHGGVWRIKFSYETGEPLSRVRFRRQ